MRGFELKCTIITIYVLCFTGWCEVFLGTFKHKD